MCGIVGIAARQAIERREWLAVGRDRLGHRGPDDKGEWWSHDSRVGFGHRRLAVIDLTPSGHQPMTSRATGNTIVFNGEIYNFEVLRSQLSSLGYDFDTGSDTEVILAAYAVWGVDCVSRFSGMFAFAIFDAVKNAVFLARDRAGEKPLFYHYDKGTLRFASELKALFADTNLVRRIDPDALDCYLGIGYVPGDKCIVEGFNKLPPAHALLLDLQQGELRSWCYWSVPKYCTTSTNCPEHQSELLDELDMLLENSVSQQLVADVPVGVLLSGGVDSSLITAMAARSSNKVRTFTIRFPGHNALDETSHARLIARHFDTDHSELVAEPVTPDVLLQLATQFDEPIIDSSMIPTYLVSQLVRKQCTVALGGDGGDELFGGYQHYSDILKFKKRIGKLPLSFRCAISASAEKCLPVGVRGRNWLQGIGLDLEIGLPSNMPFFDKTNRRKLVIGKAASTDRAKSIYASRIPANTDLLQRSTRMDFSNYLPEDILTKVDRTSMLCSLELRSPFLDHRVIEFSFGRIPSELKATEYKQKILLKNLCSRILPDEFDLSRKQGFSIPLATWIKQEPFKSYFQEVLLVQDSKLFSSRYVAALFDGFERGRSVADRIFALLMLELWCREYKVHL